ncbi:uridylate kinase PUMPKIN, chloroplastic [Arachis stenosperma]|uniref:uridylate kinase PUMPKIN, chloroplastic n=1 Tax=Arachis stenosperma TaxID=217475 RepID=UPI0025AB64FA|nr:uridylate kinase PUMPKIN, chloroplastic [Arachis stenosperma]
MASCDDDDDDFSLLHQPYAPPSHHHNYSTAVAAATTAVQPKPVSDTDAEDYSNPFDEDNTTTTHANANTTEKRKDQDEIGNNNNSNDASYGFNKRSKLSASASGSASACSGAEYRKDREEWSDTAIVCLLDAYTEKFTQLNRGNLRGRDWEEVAAVVSERCENQSKSVEQCKNKVDNLKKRYKLERHRISSGCITASHWPWFKHMENIVGNSLSAGKFPGGDEDKAIVASTAGNSPRQPKRYGGASQSSGGQVNNMKSKALSNLRWRRVILKISGAALTGSDTCNIDPKVAMLISREVAIASRLGVEVAIVVGGRNFFCGDAWVAATGLERCTAYQVGMMATMMNSILLQSTLEKMGVQTRVQSSVSMQEFAEPYNRHRAIRHLEKGRVVIFGGIGFGTGNPLFSTDIAAALRASELNAEAVLKGTNVDGVYDCNSRDNNFTFEHISFRELVSRGVTPMDMTALTFCEENAIPVVVFNILEPGNISKALCGEQVGTLVDQTGAIS